MTNPGTHRLARDSGDWMAARSSLERLFSTPDPFLPVFGSGAEAKCLLFPVDLDVDRETWFRLKSCAPRLYISVTDQWGASGFEERGHWVTDSESPPYELLDRIGWHHLEENVIYAADGSIAVLVSREEHAVVAGQRSSVEAICRDNSRCIDGRDASLSPEFVAKWAYARDHYGTDLTIVRELLGSVFGQLRAETMMRLFDRPS